MWYRGILFIIFFLASCFFLGDLLLRFLGWKRTLISAPVWGIAIIMATLQLVAYPLYRLGQSYRIFFIIYSILILFLIGLSVFAALQRKDYSCYMYSFDTFLKEVKTFPFLFSAACFLLVFFLIYTFAFYYPTTDDGYYMTRSMEIMNRNSLSVNVRTAWLGWSDEELPDFTDASTFAFLISYISTLSGIHVTILSKSFFAFCLVILHLSAIVVTVDTVTEKKENQAAFICTVLILYLIFQIFSVKASSAGTWMTGYIWNGKSMLPGFIFPMILTSCFTLIRHIDNLKKREWLSITIILLAGMAFSIVGLNLPVILYFTFGIAFLISTKFRYMKKILPGAIISVTPVAVIAIISYLFVITGQNDYYEIGINTAVNWTEQFLEAIDFFQFVLYILSLIYILLRGSSVQKALFVYAPLILLFCFLNPLFIRQICVYITSSLVYWRLWWLLPVYTLPSIVIADVIGKLCKGNLQAGFFCSLISLFVVSGFQLFRYSVTAPEYTVIPFAQNVGRLINVRPEFRYNLYGINPATYNTAKAIEDDWVIAENPRLLMFINRPYEIRQYSPDIIMVPAIRDIQLSDKTIPGTGITEAQFMKTYSEIEDGQLIKDILDYYSVDYICFDGHPAFENPEIYGFHFICNTGGIDLWRVKH